MKSARCLSLVLAALPLLCSNSYGPHVQHVQLKDVRTLYVESFKVMRLALVGTQDSVECGEDINWTSTEVEQLIAKEDSALVSEFAHKTFHGFSAKDSFELPPGFRSDAYEHYYLLVEYTPDTHEVRDVIDISGVIKWGKVYSNNLIAKDSVLTLLELCLPILLVSGIVFLALKAHQGYRQRTGDFLH
jgi:hypothetical protein